MEGLIPMVYKSLKKSKTRRKYECLSSGAASTYNIADFYVKVDRVHDSLSRKECYTPGRDEVLGRRGAHHRRYNSVGGSADAAKTRQLVRFKSHRLFSCVTGA